MQGYPIKYAILELKEKGGWVNNYEETTRGYIVSKCYIHEINTKFMTDGSSKTVYNVIFPYRDFEAFRINYKYNKESKINKAIPYNGGFYYYDKVDMVYDSKEEALEIANLKNKNLEAQVSIDIELFTENWKERLDIERKKFFDEFSLCKKFEELIEDYTSDMIVSIDNTLVKKL